MAKARLDDPLTAEQLRASLDYIPSTGAFIWRRRIVRSQYDKTWNTRYADTVAGTLTVPRCYVQILLFGRLYLAHRLAFLWMTGNWPVFEGDHEDNDPSNNRWSNLRDATSSQGKMNTRIRSDNKSGYKGVWFEKRRSHWIAEIVVDGKKRQIGAYPTPEAAKLARDAAADLLHGEFARSE